MKKILPFVIILTLSVFFAASISEKVHAQVSANMMMRHAKPYSWGLAQWGYFNNAKYYNVYYREVGEKTFTHAVPMLPATVHSYKIQYLKRGIAYEYQISVVGIQGAEYRWTEIRPLPSFPMQ